MKLTGFVLLGTLVFLLGYDLIVILTSGYQNTISDFIGTLSHDWPVIPLLTGIVIGHLFFPMKTQ